MILDHLSGRFNRLAIVLRWMIMRSVKAGVHVICLTEVDRASRGAVLYKIKGFIALRGANGWQGESAILVREEFYLVIAWGTYKAVEDVPGRRGPQVVVWAVLEHRGNGQRTFVTTTHHAKGTEKYYRKNQYPPARISHSKGIQKWSRLTLRRASLYGCEVAAATSDLNVNVRHAYLRNKIQKLLGELEFPAKMPKTGTFKRRVIDAIATIGTKNARMWVLPAHRASDHRGFRARWMRQTRGKA